MRTFESLLFAFFALNVYGANIYMEKGNLLPNDTIKQLTEIVVTANRIKDNPNGYSFFPKGSDIDNVNSTQEMLSMLPNIVEENGVITLLGRTPDIYINGIKVIDQNELRALRPRDIAKIEVDYQSIGEDVNEKHGTIRIIKKQIEGVCGFIKENIKESPAYGHTWDGNMVAIDLGLKKIVCNYWLTYDHQKLLEDVENAYHYLNSFNIISHDKTRSWNDAFSNRLNVSWLLDKRNTLAVSEYLSYSDTKNKRLSNNLLSSDSDNVSMVSSYRAPEYRLVNQTVAKYTYLCDSLGSQIEATMDYYYQKSHMSQITTKGDTRILENSSKDFSNMLKVDIRWSKLYNKGQRLILGSNFQHMETNTYAYSRINYRANIPSFFANINGSRKKFMYAVGMTLQGNMIMVDENGITSSNNKWVFCPQVNLMWMTDMKRNSSLAFMYQRGVNTLPYSVISDYRYFDSEFHYTSGNSKLKIPDEHQFALQYKFNSHILIMLMHYYIKDYIYYTHGVDETMGNVAWSRPQNCKYEARTTIGTEFNYRPSKWWLTKIRISGDQIRFATKDYTTIGHWCGKIWWRNIFMFSPSAGGSLNAYWETGTKFENYSWKPVGSVIGGLWKEMFDKRLRLELTTSIIGRQRESRTFSDFYTSSYHNQTKVMSFQFSATWSFGEGERIRKHIEADGIQSYNQITERR